MLLHRTSSSLLKEVLTPLVSFTLAAPFTSLPWPLLFHFFLRFFPYVFDNKLKLPLQRPPAVPHDKCLSWLSRISQLPWQVVIIFSVIRVFCVLCFFSATHEENCIIICRIKSNFCECAVYLNVQYSQLSSDVELFFHIHELCIWKIYIEEGYYVAFWQTNAIK